MDEQKKVTFYNHEVVGATQTYDFMKRIGFTEGEAQRVSLLVRHHQFRFYEDTSDKTITKWLQTLGKTGFYSIMKLRLADRAGNLSTKGKPEKTKEFSELFERCDKMIRKGEVLFIEDLQVKTSDLYRLNIPKKRHKEAMRSALAVVTLDKKKNQKKILIEFLRKNFSAKDEAGTDGSSDLDN